MLLIVYSIAIILGFLLPKNRIVGIFLYAFLVFIFTTSTKHADYAGYLGTYESVKSPSEYTEYFINYELAYKLLVRTSVYMGFSYELFLFLVSSILFLSVYFCMLRLTKYVNPVLACYLIYPFLLDVVQLRNFIGECFLFFSLYFLLNYKKYSVILSAISLLIGTGFQIVFAYYLSIIILFRKSLKYSVIFIAIPIATIVFLLKLGYEIPFSEKVIYFQNSSSPLMFFSLALIYIINLIILLRTVNYTRQENQSINNKLVTNEVLKYGYQLKIINYIIFFSLPLLVFGVDFTRIHRNISFFNFLYVFTAIYTYKSKKLIIYGVIFLILQAVNAWLFYFYIGYELIFNPILLR